MTLRATVLFWLASCGGEPATTPTTPSSSPAPTGETGAMTAPLTLEDLSGTWRGSIGQNYESGCLCLTLDPSGEVIGPSGITLGFPVTSSADTPDVTILDADQREIRIHMLVSGSGFRVDNAAVNGAVDAIDGDWLGDTPSMFDGQISLDREPASCLERTGLYGAPC